MTEAWKPIKDYGGIYEGSYEISNLGRVKSLRRLSPKNTWLKEKIIKICKTKDGYSFLRLHKNTVIMSVRVHRLVAKAFLPNPLNYPQVNHIDGVKSNNRVDNLEWCNQEQNMKHAIKMNLIVTEKTLASRIKRSIMVRQFDLNGNYIATHASMCKATIAVCGMSGANSISNCLRGKQYKAYGFKWKKGFEND